MHPKVFKFYLRMGWEISNKLALTSSNVNVVCEILYYKTIFKKIKKIVKYFDLIILNIRRIYLFQKLLNT